MPVAAPSRCSVCRGEHDDERHEHRLATLREYRKRWEREQREELGGAWCGVCKGICIPRKHQHRLEIQRKSHQRAEAKRRKVERQREWRREHPDYWKKYVTPRTRKQPPSDIALDYYPYNADHPLVLQANELIPKSLPEQVRADACQEFILAMIEGRKPEVLEVVRKSWRQNRTWAMSLETPIDGTPLRELL